MALPPRMAEPGDERGRLLGSHRAVPRRVDRVHVQVLRHADRAGVSSKVWKLFSPS